jgi:hypothetical protein
LVYENKRTPERKGELQENKRDERIKKDKGKATILEKKKGKIHTHAALKMGPRGVQWTRKPSRKLFLLTFELPHLPLDNSHYGSTLVLMLLSSDLSLFQCSTLERRSGLTVGYPSHWHIHT